MYMRYFLKSLSLSDAHDITMVTDEPMRMMVLSVASGTFRNSRPWCQVPAGSARAQQHVRGEQGAEEHHLGGEEEPDAQLGVIQAGIGTGPLRYRESPSLQASWSWCWGVKSFDAPGRL